MRLSTDRIRSGDADRSTVPPERSARTAGPGCRLFPFPLRALGYSRIALLGQNYRGDAPRRDELPSLPTLHSRSSRKHIEVAGVKSGPGLMTNQPVGTPPRERVLPLPERPPVLATIALGRSDSPSRKRTDGNPPDHTKPVTCKRWGSRPADIAPDHPHGADRSASWSRSRIP
jgi:hypothetical protein